jgi:hypothetical protein
LEEKLPETLIVPAAVKVIRHPDVDTLTSPIIVAVPVFIERRSFLPDVDAFIVNGPEIRNPSPTIKEFVILPVGFSMVIAEVTVRVNPELIVNDVFVETPAISKVEQVYDLSTYILAPLIIVTASPGPTPWEE